jgi:hypothetical protein
MNGNPRPYAKQLLMLLRNIVCCRRWKI